VQRVARHGASNRFACVEGQHSSLVVKVGTI